VTVVNYWSNHHSDNWVLEK